MLHASLRSSIWRARLILLENLDDAIDGEAQDILLRVFIPQISERFCQILKAIITFQYSPKGARNQIGSLKVA